MFGAHDDGEGAARRRRERRLRSWLKHERQSVAMALAEQKHHASWGQMRARAREELHEMNHAPWRPKPPPPTGIRPGVLKEPVAALGAVSRGSRVGYGGSSPCAGRARRGSFPR